MPNDPYQNRGDKGASFLGPVQICDEPAMTF